MHIFHSFTLAKFSLQCNTDISMEEEDTGDTVAKEMKNESSIFAAKRRITKHDIRIRTVTSSVDATIKASLLAEPDILRCMDRNTKVLGVLRQLLSVYVNCLIDDEGLHARAAEIVFYPAVLYHVLMHLIRSAMRKANKKSPRKLDIDRHKLVKNHVQNYTLENMKQVSVEQQNRLPKFPRSPARELCRLMLTI